MKIEKIYWWLLKKSGVFRYCYKKELSDLLYRLERFDLDGDETMKFYLEKYKKITNK